MPSNERRVFFPRRQSDSLVLPFSVKRKASSSSRNASKPASLVIFAPRNSSLSLLSDCTQSACFRPSPIGCSSQNCWRPLKHGAKLHESGHRERSIWEIRVQSLREPADHRKRDTVPSAQHRINVNAILAHNDWPVGTGVWGPVSTGSTCQGRRSVCHSPASMGVEYIALPP